MSLRERMQQPRYDGEEVKSLYSQYGIVKNPFPASGQSSGHPRLEDELDDKIAKRFKEFEIKEFKNNPRRSQVILIEGTQGVGKTNLLNYYEEQFRDYYDQDESFYIIRYYPDPEPSFDAIVRKIFQSLDQHHFEKLARALASADNRDSIKDIAKGFEVRCVLNGIERVAREEGDVQECSRLALEWFSGMRILKKHREVLGVNFRLDTVEARTRALRDITYVSEKLDLLRGILLLLDELEKQDYSMSKTPVLRFLSAIRALVDALPRCLFLILAMTPQARLRYFSMLPALAGRLQDILDLPTVNHFDNAFALYEFYVGKERSSARLQVNNNSEQGKGSLFDKTELRSIFERLKTRSEKRGTQGVTQRDLLHALYEKWRDKVSSGPLA